MLRNAPHPLALLVVCAVLLTAGEVSARFDWSGEQAARASATSAWRRLGDMQAEAASLMEKSLASIAAHRREKGLRIDPALDPNGTGIIGDEFTPLTTSLGDVQAKRTGTNPAFAALVVKYFNEAGLGPGDVVAVGASGSFPAFVLATLCAARAHELEPLVIYSIGASMYGANLPGFTFVDMLEGLRADGLLPYRLMAVSPGGRDDLGKGVLFDEDGTSGALLAEARHSGVPVIEAQSLGASIEKRLALYDAAAAGRPIRLFVNVGGAAPNYGDGPASLELHNGLVLRAGSLPSGATRGLVFEFLSRGVPVVHLLYAKGLAEANGLPYDPVPLPRAGNRANISTWHPRWGGVRRSGAPTTRPKGADAPLKRRPTLNVDSSALVAESQSLERLAR